MTTSTTHTWNVPTLEKAIKDISHESYPVVTVNWSDEKGNSLTRKNNPKHLTLITSDHLGMQDRIRKLPGCIKVTRLGEIRSDGPAAFVIVKSETTYLRAIFSKQADWS